eukprot:10962685-Ditylum_brightwellii.AAC.1
MVCSCSLSFSTQRLFFNRIVSVSIIITLLASQFKQFMLPNIYITGREKKERDADGWNNNNSSTLLHYQGSDSTNQPWLPEDLNTSLTNFTSTRIKYSEYNPEYSWLPHVENKSISDSNWDAMLIISHLPVFNQTCFAFFHISDQHYQPIVGLHPMWGRIPATAL